MAGCATRDPFQSSALFQGLDGAALDRIRASAVLRHHAIGTTLIKQGDDPTHLFVIASGKVKVGHVTEEGGQLALDYLGSGAVVGCIGVMRRVVYPVSATAVESTTALAWTAGQVEAWFEEHPMVLRNFARLFCDQLNAMLERLREVTTERVEQRVARAVRRLLASPGWRAAGDTPALPMSRQDLAELTGATLFTVSRIMSAWEQRGIVESRRQRIMILDSNRLEILAEGG